MNLTEIKSTLIKKSYFSANHPSGLKIYLYPMPGFSSCYGLFGTKYGSIDNAYTDDTGNVVTLPEGIAHFLEHKLFESEDGDAFTKYAKTGAYSNAYTSFDRTCYLFSCSNRFYDNLGILLDFVRSPYFTAETVNKEQGIIGQEIKMYDDMPSWRVMFNMLGGMFHNFPIKVDIAGTVESISKITDKTLYDCYNRFYDLSNMFLVLAGDFDCNDVLDFIKQNLKVKKSVFEETKSFFDPEPDTVVKNRISCNLDVAKPLFSLGFKGKNIGKSPTAFDMAATEILLKMLVGTASPLYKELLEKNLINEEFSMEYFTGRGFSLPLFEGESNNPEKVLELILSAAEGYREKGPDKVLFEAVRRELFGAAIRRFDGAEGIASIISDSEILGYKLFDYFETINSITPKDIIPYLDIFTADRAVLSVVNPINS